MTTELSGRAGMGTVTTVVVYPLRDPVSIARSPEILGKDWTLHGGSCIHRVASLTAASLLNRDWSVPGNEKASAPIITYPGDCTHTMASSTLCGCSGLYGESSQRNGARPGACP